MDSDENGGANEPARDSSELKNSSSSEQQESEPVQTQPLPGPQKSSFPSKFQLSSDLTDGKVSLGDGERIIETWKFESTSMSTAEWCATIISFGLYYFMTRVVLQRKRYYHVYVTNLNVIVKEEMSETSWGCLKLLMENQASFPISSLAFLTAEVMGAKACGIIPASVVLEMRFGRYPVDSEYPVTVYRYENICIVPMHQPNKVSHLPLFLNCYTDLCSRLSFLPLPWPPRKHTSKSLASTSILRPSNCPCRSSRPSL